MRKLGRIVCLQKQLGLTECRIIRSKRVKCRKYRDTIVKNSLYVQKICWGGRVGEGRSGGGWIIEEYTTCPVLRLQEERFIL